MYIPRFYPVSLAAVQNTKYWSKNLVIVDLTHCSSSVSFQALSALNVLLHLKGNGAVYKDLNKSSCHVLIDHAGRLRLARVTRYR